MAWWWRRELAKSAYEQGRRTVALVADGRHDEAAPLEPVGEGFLINAFDQGVMDARAELPHPLKRLAP